MSRADAVRVRFEPSGREVAARRGAWLAGLAVGAGERIVFDCDGQGVCATCRVRIDAGRDVVSPVDPLEREQLGDAVEDGWRLACLLRIEGNCVVRVPQEGFAYPPRLQRGG